MMPEWERARIAYVSGLIVGAAERVKSLMAERMPEDWNDAQAQEIGAACRESAASIQRAMERAD